jgi:preprotein translocase subunit SecA
VLNHQRNIIYKRRRHYVPGTDEANQFDLKTEILAMVKEEIGEVVVLQYSSPAKEEYPAPAGGGGINKNPLDAIAKQLNTLIPVTPELIKRAKEAGENAADKEFAVTDAFYQTAQELWDAKEKEMGKEVFEGGQRFVALQALDTLWMEHLDTMDHLRDSVRLRGYGQRDPLVEYKKEGYQMFQNLIAEINKQIVYTIFHINVQQQPQQVQGQPMNLVTNLSDGSSPANAQPSVDPKFAGVGRNDPCPCGSGKKFKKCGLLNTSEHQQNMIKPGASHQAKVGG